MTQDNYVIKNGKLIPKEQASISVFNKALFFDFCVYSNIKVVQGKPYMAKIEIEKLFESASAIGLEHKYIVEEVVGWAQELIEKNKLKDALIRILLIGAEKGSNPQLFLFAVGLTFYPDKFYREGVKLITFKGERYFPTAKTKNLLMSYHAYNRASKSGALDALLIDRDSNICEGTRSSFMAIIGNKLLIPKADKTLPGLTKSLILKIAPQVLQIEERDISINEIKDFDECFISATTMKIMSVTQIDDIVIGSGVGEKTKELMKLFKEFKE